LLISKRISAVKIQIPEKRFHRGGISVPVGIVQGDFHGRRGTGPGVNLPPLGAAGFAHTGGFGFHSRGQAALCPDGTAQMVQIQRNPGSRCQGHRIIAGFRNCSKGAPKGYSLIQDSDGTLVQGLPGAVFHTVLSLKDHLGQGGEIGFLHIRQGAKHQGTGQQKQQKITWNLPGKGFHGQSLPFKVFSVIIPQRSIDGQTILLFEERLFFPKPFFPGCEAVFLVWVLCLWYIPGPFRCRSNGRIVSKRSSGARTTEPKAWL